MQPEFPGHQLEPISSPFLSLCLASFDRHRKDRTGDPSSRNGTELSKMQTRAWRLRA